FRLEQLSRPFTLITTDNLGRDILPFLRTIPEIMSSGFRYALKIHTKRSTHRQDGDLWRRKLYETLLSYDNVERAAELMHRDPTIGLLGASEHYLGMSTYYGSNRKRIVELARRMGVDEPELMQTGFFAGSMFAARV